MNNIDRSKKQAVISGRGSTRKSETISRGMLIRVIYGRAKKR
jgi:hypothetical protein